MKTNSGKKGEGMPVVRNPQFYFREGFCWNLINGTRSENDLKFKFCSPCVNDVGSMKLCSYSDKISSKFLICIGNSDFASRYTEAYVNFTVNFQVNDCRQIPIVIPDSEQLKAFETLFEQAYAIKKKQFQNKITSAKAEEELSVLQQKLDKMVYSLYAI
ncbi:MAG: DNA modification methylase [Bacteroidota bacterium]|nr:DNA modification methylase [Bacteroidota bacterium]